MLQTDLARLLGGPSTRTSHRGVTHLVDTGRRCGCPGQLSLANFLERYRPQTCARQQHDAHAALSMLSSVSGRSSDFPAAKGKSTSISSRALGEDNPRRIASRVGPLLGLFAAHPAKRGRPRLQRPYRRFKIGKHPRDCRIKAPFSASPPKFDLLENAEKNWVRSVKNRTVANLR
jgi:hypothetical protein